MQLNSEEQDKLKEGKLMMDYDKKWRKVANVKIKTCMQVNYLREWRAGRQKEGETKQICAPYLTAMFNWLLRGMNWSTSEVCFL
jgi:hypothetical protein